MELQEDSKYYWKTSSDIESSGTIDQIKSSPRCPAAQNNEPVSHPTRLD